jgi:hypothetical protein
MADQIAIQLPKTKWREGSAFTATAYFRTRSTAAADTPASVKYRIDCLTTCTELADWTTVSAASNVSIAITATHNAIQNECNKTELKQLTIASDFEAVDQHRESVVWTVENLYGSP